jgi:hypothetical protein
MKCPNCGLYHSNPGKKLGMIEKQLGWLGCNNIHGVAASITKGAHFQPVDTTITLFLTMSFSTDFKYPLHPWRVSKLLHDKSDGHDTFPSKEAALMYIVVMYADAEFETPNIRIIDII